MELAIKNKWITLGGSSTVQDLEGKDVLYVKGRIFSFTRKKFIQDMEGNLKFIVRNKFWRLFQRKAFVENTNGEIIATIRRKIFSLHDHYYVYSNLGDLQIRGNILGFDYHITLDGKEIGHISRKISLRDSYVLSIDDSYDYVTFVALVIAVDNITDRRRQDSSSSSYDSSSSSSN